MRAEARRGKEMQATVYVRDSPSSAGEQRKDKQVINTAGCHPGALESFSRALSPTSLQSITAQKQYTRPVKPKCKLT